MMRRLFSSVCVVAGILVGISIAAGHAATSDDIVGTWLTEKSDGAIEILPCGEQRCGRIVWMKSNEENGHVPTDRNNRDPSLRSRPICGLTIISGLTRQNDGTWSGGRVYNPDNGETYDMEIQRIAPDTLKVTGYLGLKLFGQSMSWRQAPKNLGMCNAESKPLPRRRSP